MKAGQYAVVDGVEYVALFSRGSVGVSLVVPNDQPRPDGFEHDERFVWRRSVPWSSIERIVEVETWARDAEGHALRIWFPPRGTTAFVAHSRDPGPYSDVPPGHPSNLRFEAIDNEWVGYLEVDALRDVREIHHDVSVATYSTPREQRPRR